MVELADMEMRPIGGLEVSVVGLGTNNFGRGMQADDVAPVVHAALDCGINFFDTADSYGDSEERLGQALGRHRDQVVIATKFGNPVGPDVSAGASPGYVREAVDRSLRQLDTDRIDLYQLHRPDPETPIADTLGILDELVRQGKVREIGCSNFSAAQLREADAAVAPGGSRFVSVQNLYNLLDRTDEQEVLPECERLRLAYLPYFPLASGLLTGKYTRGEAPPEGTRLQRWGDRVAGLLTDRNFDVTDAVSAWAAERDRSLLDVAVAWLVANPVVASVIAGATKVEQVRANAAAGQWRLSPGDVAEVEAFAPDPD
jgi:aryl-alcohol dehydrogenase-like predicted oxidoreductase